MGFEKYDIIIIGSGLGGLSAATLLSRKGFKTLVLEKKKYIGGRFSTINYKGFQLPTGAIIIPDSWVIRLLKDLKIDMSHLRPVSRVFYRINGNDYEISMDIGLPMLLDLIDKLEKEDKKKEIKIKPVNVKKIIDGYLRGKRGIKRKEVITVHDWLLQFTENKKIHEVFDNLCSALMMAHSWELPVLNFFRFKEMKKFYVSSKGNINLANELAKIIQKNGDVWTNCNVKNIVIKDGKAEGVIMEKDGKIIEILSKIIISNVGPKMTVELAGQENFNDEYLTDLRVRLRPSPSILVFVASDKPLCLEGIRDGLLNILGGRRIVTIVPISNICPELVPNGQHLLYTSVEPISCVHPIEAKCEIQQIKHDLNELLPDFQKHGRILKIKICYDKNQSPESWTWLGYGLPLETPILNLYNVGDGCVAPGLIGTSGSVESGYRAAKVIENTLNNGN